MKNYAGSMGSRNLAGLIVDLLEEHFARMSCGVLIPDTTHVKEYSRTLAGQGPVDAGLVQKYVKSWKEMRFLK